MTERYFSNALLSLPWMKSAFACFSNRVISFFAPSAWPTPVRCRPKLQRWNLSRQFYHTLFAQRLFALWSIGSANNRQAWRLCWRSCPWRLDFLDQCLTLMLHKFSAQDRFAASIAAFSGPCSLFHFLLRELTYDYRDVIGRLRLEQAVECQLCSG